MTAPAAATPSPPSHRMLSLLLPPRNPQARRSNPRRQPLALGAVALSLPARPQLSRNLRCHESARKQIGPLQSFVKRPVGKFLVLLRSFLHGFHLGFRRCSTGLPPASPHRSAQLPPGLPRVCYPRMKRPTHTGMALSSKAERPTARNGSRAKPTWLHVGASRSSPRLWKTQPSRSGRSRASNAYTS